MAALTICSDFGAQENKVCHRFHCDPIYLPWSGQVPWSGTGCHDMKLCKFCIIDNYKQKGTEKYLKYCQWWSLIDRLMGYHFLSNCSCFTMLGFWCTAKWFSHIYTHTHIHTHTHTYIYMFFFRFFSIIGYLDTKYSFLCCSVGPNCWFCI